MQVNNILDWINGNKHTNTNLLKKSVEARICKLCTCTTICKIMHSPIYKLNSVNYSLKYVTKSKTLIYFHTI